MKNLITEKFASKTVIVVLSLVVVMHLLVITGLISFDFVWGGRINSRGDMLRLETISILINLVMLTVVLIRAGFVRVSIDRRIITAAIWVMFVLFCVNTIGNFFSENKFEKMIFTPLTMLLALACLKIATSNQKEVNSVKS